MASYASKMTSNGKVTIPERIREVLGIREGDLVEFKQVGDAFALRKIRIDHEALDTIRAKVRRSGMRRERADDIVEKVRHRLWRER